jgi:hypothetical protein
MSDASEALITGQAWRDFCTRLAEAGEIVLRTDAPDTSLDRAEGFRYLSRLLRIGLDMNLEHADPDFPSFYRASHETAKIGADNPDNVYLNATISGANDYRITGRRGSIAYLSVGSKANRYHIDGTMASTGELYDADIPVGPDREVEIIASATPKPGAWLPLAADSSMIIIRQSYLDRATEQPGAYRIERIGAAGAPAPLDAAFTAAALKRTADFVFGTARTFADWSAMFKQHPNELPDYGQPFFQKAGGDPKIFYYHGYWRLEPGQAWVIETDVPDCPYWNFQLNNWWMESLDYRYRQISLNKHTAKLEPDGRLVLVIAERDPGFGNWIDAAGHTSGTALLRWVDARTHPQPQCRVVAL